MPFAKSVLLFPTAGENPMSNIEKISIALTPEMAANVKGLVAKGEFASSSEVIRAALREFQENREKKALILEQIGKAWDEGINSGAPIPAEEVFEDLRILIDNIKNRNAA